MFKFKSVPVLTALVVTLLLSACANGDSGAEAPAVSESTSTSTTSTPETTNTLESDSALVSDLFYQDQIAASKSMQDLFDFQIANTYPGAVNVDVATANFSKVGLMIPYGVPDLTTLRLDPNWVVPVICEADVDLGGPPKGTTYIVTAESEDGLSQVHITILDGKAYYYPGFCLD